MSRNTCTDVTYRCSACGRTPEETNLGYSEAREDLVCSRCVAYLGEHGHYPDEDGPERSVTVEYELQPDTERKLCADCGDQLRGDDVLALALRHYLDEHPRSETLKTIVGDVHLKCRCEECDEPFIGDLRVTVDHEEQGRLTVPRYCSRCQIDDPLREMFVCEVEPAEAVARQICHETDSYRLDGSDVNPEWKDVYLRCPDCDNATTVDLPRGKCDHCETTISLIVRSGVCHEANHCFETATDNEEESV